MQLYECVCEFMRASASECGWMHLCVMHRKVRPIAHMRCLPYLRISTFLLDCLQIILVKIDKSHATTQAIGVI